MRVEHIKRQICLLLSIMTILSGMCLFSEQADACFWWNASISSQGMEQRAILSSGETIPVQDFSCTGEMLGAKSILSAQNAVSRYFSGVRNKIILAFAFVGLFLFILIMFQMAVDQFGFCNKPGHTVIIQYIHHKDGQKTFHYNIRITKDCNGGKNYADGLYTCSNYGSSDDSSWSLGMVE